MTVAFKLLPSLIGNVSPELGFPINSGRYRIRFGTHFDNRKSKFGQLVKAVGRLDETSSLNDVNGQSDCDCTNGFPNGKGTFRKQMSTIEKSTNILWHECSVNKHDREQLLQQKGCVIWITGLSGSGKSTLACALSHSLHSRGKLSYVLDGDNVRHGLNKNLSFGAEDRAENIRRVGEVAKLFADAGVICIASLISPYRKDRDACRALLPKGDFIELSTHRFLWMFHFNFVKPGTQRACTSWHELEKLKISRG
ncbi:adenylyl-sulfate kinase 3-like isoform X2 [Chenopodium quinoa]|uniref:adenylyl-sulfate kinase 3-like isoform X2 n=1 Tax=Chenopodium quinoa TaxID=63459 RepID=UPI000B784AB6|nr:adenylyl-sulfate kinase 3-like isoform X2 [Chenopodium quinoa]